MNLIRTRVNLLGPKHLHRTKKTCKTLAECFNLKKRKKKKICGRGTHLNMRATEEAAAVD